MPKRRGVLTGLTGLLLAAACASVGMADDKSKRRQDKKYKSEVNQDQILEALKRNEIRPLSEVMAVAEKAMPGQIVGVKVKRINNNFVYEFKIITAGGRLREIYIDAATLEIERVE